MFKRHFAVSSTVSRGTKRGTKGGAFACTTDSESACGKLDRVILVAAIDSHGLVDEGEDVVEEVN